MVFKLITVFNDGWVSNSNYYGISLFYDGLESVRKL